MQAFLTAAVAEINEDVNALFIAFFQLRDEEVEQLGDSFWNFRGSFKLAGKIQIGTHMSLIKLSTGRFVLVDTIPLHKDVKATLDELTVNGSLIEAVLATHPFHTLAFPKFYEAYPNLKYYGTPRHLRVLPQIPWAGELHKCEMRDQFQPDIFMEIPAGAEFVDPRPAARNHFSCVWVYHPKSKTLHVDDTLMIGHNPGLLMRAIGGFEHGKIQFHPSIKGPGLHPGPQSVTTFRQWLARINTDWDIDTVCASHMGSKIGDCKLQINALLANEKYWDNLSRSKRDEEAGDTGGLDNVEGDECG